MSAHINTQGGGGETVSEHLNHFLIRCIKFYEAETRVKKKKERRGRKRLNGSRPEKRAALC